MGMDLSGPAGDFWWDYFSWHKLLRVAERSGWRPVGTLLPSERMEEIPDGRWDGGYTSNDYQIVTAVDAEHLATALERALPDISDADMLAPVRTEEGGIVIAPDGPEIDDLDWFCGPESKEHIRAFIRYCRAGAFSIG